MKVADMSKKRLIDNKNVTKVLDILETMHPLL